MRREADGAAGGDAVLAHQPGGPSTRRSHEWQRWRPAPHTRPSPPRAGTAEHAGDQLGVGGRAAGFIARGRAAPELTQRECNTHKCVGDARARQWRVAPVPAPAPRPGRRRSPPRRSCRRARRQPGRTPGEVPGLGGAGAPRRQPGACGTRLDAEDRHPAGGVVGDVHAVDESGRLQRAPPPSSAWRSPTPGRGRAERPVHAGGGGGGGGGGGSRLLGGGAPRGGHGMPRWR